MSRVVLVPGGTHDFGEHNGAQNVNGQQDSQQHVRVRKSLLSDILNTQYVYDIVWHDCFNTTPPPTENAVGNPKDKNKRSRRLLWWRNNNNNNNDVYETRARHVTTAVPDGRSRFEADVHGGPVFYAEAGNYDREKNFADVVFSVARYSHVIFPAPSSVLPSSSSSSTRPSHQWSACPPPACRKTGSAYYRRMHTHTHIRHFVIIIRIVLPLGVLSAFVFIYPRIL